MYSISYKAYISPDRDLVYLPTLKAASMFFGMTVKNLGFTDIDFVDIDWKNMRVFSHIFHPLVRRAKGISEFFNDINGLPAREIVDYVTHNQQILQVLQTPFFDEHSAPLTLLYGKHITDIEFIPIDDPTIDYINITRKLLESHNLNPVFPKEKVNTADSDQVLLYNIIEQHYQSAIKHSDLIGMVFQDDIALYERIISSYHISS